MDYKLPKATPFLGDFSQSWTQWLAEFQFHLDALVIPPPRRVAVLMCYLRGPAFTLASQYINAHANATFAELADAINAAFMTDAYRRALEIRYADLKFSANDAVPEFASRITTMISELFELDTVLDVVPIEAIATHKILSSVSEGVKNKVRAFQIGAIGRVRLAQVLEMIQIFERPTTPPPPQNPPRPTTPTATAARNTNIDGRLSRLEAIVVKIESLRSRTHARTRDNTGLHEAARNHRDHNQRDNNQRDHNQIGHKHRGKQHRDSTYRAHSRRQQC